MAKLRGIKYIVHFHLDVGASGFFGRIFIIYKRLVWGPLLRNAAHIISCANDQVVILENKYGVDKGNITVIPNAVSSDFFLERAYNPSKDKLRLLCIGRIAPQKRLERIIEAMAKLKIPAELTIVGDGEEKEKLEKLAQKIGLNNIIFVGKKNDLEIQEYQLKHDVFVISSDREGMPLAVLEGMAAGLPIVATKVEGLTELIEGTGVLVEEPYPDNFARILETLWENPNELTALSDKSRVKSKQYGWERFIDSILLVYRNSI